MKQRFIVINEKKLKEKFCELSGYILHLYIISGYIT